MAAAGTVAYYWAVVRPLPRPALAVVYYHNRSKRGSLELLRRWSERTGTPLLLLANRTADEVAGLVDEQLVIDFGDLESAAGALRHVCAGGLRVAGCVPFGEDEVPLVSVACEALRLPGNPLETSILTRHKRAMRERMRALGVPVPRWFPVGDVGEARRVLRERFLAEGRTAFLKPPLGTGSMFCAEVADEDALDRLWEPYHAGSREVAVADPLWSRLFGPGREPYHLLLEDRLGTYSLPWEDALRDRFPVHEVSVDGIVTGAGGFVHGITDKLVPDSRDGREHLWRTTRLPASLRAVLERRALALARGVGMRVGGFHLELRLEAVAPESADAVIDGTPVRAVPLELASRLGGASMQTFWHEATGFDAVGFLAYQACGMAAATGAPHLRPSIMLNLWPDGDGRLAAVEGVEAVAREHGDLLREAVVYDGPGDRVLLSPAAERGVGHVRFLDASLDLAGQAAGETPAAAAAYLRLERALLFARDTIRVRVD